MVDILGNIFLSSLIMVVVAYISAISSKNKIYHVCIGFVFFCITIGSILAANILD